ncbi:hypothetical protein [Bailinhaonella thermotolerans]|uniref:hypothetical protein n=1 Tax=Bailinhaonella thermotolerans TaxID=1070861 RepID=UPI00192A5C09|nr:hypothetical protein [Bailinhaonella thermotolerans]
MRTREQSRDTRTSRPDTQTTAQRGLSGPASRKLPVPPRERKPALAALAVLLILGGALATTWLVMRSGDRVSAIRITQKIGAGQPITEQAMEEVQIADTGIEWVAWSERFKVARSYAAVDLVPGTLFTNAMARQTPEFGPGRAIVGLALKPGQVPGDIQRGDRVQIIYTPGEGRSAQQGRLLASGALVDQILYTAKGGGASLSVVVDAAQAPVIAGHSSRGEVSVAEVPAGAGAGTAPAPAESDAPAPPDPGASQQPPPASNPPGQNQGQNQGPGQGQNQGRTPGPGQGGN